MFTDEFVKSWGDAAWGREERDERMDRSEGLVVVRLKRTNWQNQTSPQKSIREEGQMQRGNLTGIPVPDVLVVVGKGEDKSDTLRGLTLSLE